MENQKGPFYSESEQCSFLKNISYFALQATCAFLAAACFLIAFSLDEVDKYEEASIFLAVASVPLMILVVSYFSQTQLYKGSPKKILYGVSFFIAASMGGYLIYLSSQYALNARNPVTRFGAENRDPSGLPSSKLMLSFEFNIKDRSTNAITAGGSTQIPSLFEAADLKLEDDTPAVLGPVECLLQSSNDDNKREFKKCTELPSGSSVEEIRQQVFYDLKPERWAKKNSYLVNYINKEETVWQVDTGSDVKLTSEAATFYNFEDWTLIIGNPNGDRKSYLVHFGQMSGTEQKLQLNGQWIEKINMKHDKSVWWFPELRQVKVDGEYSDSNWQDTRFAVSIFFFGDAQGNVRMKTEKEEALFGFNAVFTALLAVAGPLTGMIALVFPNSLPMRYYAFADKKPGQKLDIKTPDVEMQKYEGAGSPHGSEVPDSV
jgi:hypothetical protein